MILPYVITIFTSVLCIVMISLYISQQRRIDYLVSRENELGQIKQTVHNLVINAQNTAATIQSITTFISQDVSEIYKPYIGPVGEA